jgi:hypothetical protein
MKLQNYLAIIGLIVFSFACTEEDELSEYIQIEGGKYKVTNARYYDGGIDTVSNGRVFTLEIANSADKPYYFAQFKIVSPDVSEEGNNIIREGVYTYDPEKDATFEFADVRISVFTEYDEEYGITDGVRFFDNSIFIDVNGGTMDIARNGSNYTFDINLDLIKKEVPTPAVVKYSGTIIEVDEDFLY